MLELDARRRIYDLIMSAPGVHLREIERRLNIAVGHLRYHLDSLERRKLIFSRMDGYHKRYFVKGQLNGDQERIISALRKRHVRNIVLHLLNKPGTSQRALADVFGFAPATTSLYLNELIEKGVIERTGHGRENRYRVVDEQKVVRALVTYKRSFIDELVDRALEIYEESHR